MKTCPTGKIRHNNQDAALRQLAMTGIQNRLEGNPLRTVGLMAYLCDACGSWHVGHRPGTRRLRAGKPVFVDVEAME